VQCHGDVTDAGFDAVDPRPDAAEVPEGGGQTDGAMPAHAQHTDIVEEDHSARCRGIDGRQQQGPDEDVRPAGFVHHARAEGVVLFGENTGTISDGAATEIGHTGDDNPRRFPACVAVDHVDFAHGGPESKYQPGYSSGGGTRLPTHRCLFLHRIFL